MTNKYQLSSLAAEDLKGIANYTLQKWGKKQSYKHKDGLKQAFKLLSKDVFLGIDSESISVKLRKFIYQSHVIFYQPTDYGIFIVRVLHASRDLPNILK